MLEVADLTAWYGAARVLRNVSLTVGEGEVVTLVGRNGAGKTTLLRCVMGLHPRTQGRTTFAGHDVTAQPPEARARAGMGYVPDDRGIYTRLSVEEHLLLPPRVGASTWTLERIYRAFPNLGQRRRRPASTLSGGEQQMLSIARVLRMGARLLLLDEPTEGLAPVLVEQIAELLGEAKREGRSILLVEQNLHFATTVADRHYLLAHGEIVDVLDNKGVVARQSELLRHLGV